MTNFEHANLIFKNLDWIYTRVRSDQIRSDPSYRSQLFIHKHPGNVRKYT